MSQDWITHRLDVRDGQAPRLDQEWLLTNGSGAYAMGTARGVNTRRYHGLLIAAQHPPVGRVLLLSQVLEELTLDTQASRPLAFASCLFRSPDAGDVFSPAGHTQLAEFEKGLVVRWTYRVRSIELVRELELPWKQQAAVLRYTLRGHESSGTLRIAPMLALRDFHGMTYRGDGGPPTCTRRRDDREVTISRGHGPTLAATLLCSAGRFAVEPNADAQWWYGVYYPVEAERGQESREDLHVPGAFEVPVTAGQPLEVTLTVTLGDKAWEDTGDAGGNARARHLGPMADALRAADAEAPGMARMLAIAADDFVVDRTVRGRALSTILAGYPWFADWGRDTFIALPGLLLETGRLDEARATLQTFAEAICNGLVPNRFDDYDDRVAHYNTVDASLWFVHAALAYVDAAHDAAAWKAWLGQAVREVLEAYIRGTDGPITMDQDGLIVAGHAGTQLTWMDAKHGDEVFTPRYGKAVEINALWHHGLRGVAARMTEGGDAATGRRFAELAERTAAAFPAVFWDEQRGYLRDCVYRDEAGVEHADASLRPNQLLAISLPNSPLSPECQGRVLSAVRQSLLTPMGIRTLPVDDPNYHGRCIGSPYQRDAAYHRGTVWPWLIGPYAEAVLRVGRFSPAARAEARDVLRPLLREMTGRGLGQLHEIHDGDPPHRPAGCIAQAWSVAEVLRVWMLTDGR